MKNYVKIFYVIISSLFLLYLLIPNQEFPEPPPNSLQSFEPADTESSYRRAYFTNSDREEVMDHYKKILSKSDNIPILAIRLNYPPEEAQTIIRDQTRSTFLEEIVQPFRYSFFVNGFKPSLKKDAIIIEGKNWEQKITVKSVQSNIFPRVSIALIVVAAFWILINEWEVSIKNIIKVIKK